MMPNMIPPSKEEEEEHFQSILQQIKEVSLREFVGKLLESSDAQIQSLTRQKEDIDKQIAILQAEKKRMFDLYREVGT